MHGNADISRQDAVEPCCSREAPVAAQSEDSPVESRRSSEIGRSHDADRPADHAPEDSPVIHPSWGYRTASRCLDIVVSASALVVFAPLMLVIALAVRLDSPGPALFLHRRIGRNRRHGRERRGRIERGKSGGVATASPGVEPRVAQHSGRRRRSDDRRSENRFGEPFVLHKFRTMYSDARERFPSLYAYQYSEEDLQSLPVKVLFGSDRAGDDARSDYALGADPRLSRVGRWLRRTSLDELPNFIDVLRGDMSLVGPRPDISENAHHYRPEHLCKFDVKPGVTGLAQINGRGKLPLHVTNEWDVEYIRKRSFSLDLKILMSTVRVVLKGDGAY